MLKELTLKFMMRIHLHQIMNFVDSIFQQTETTSVMAASLEILAESTIANGCSKVEVIIQKQQESQRKSDQFAKKS